MPDFDYHGQLLLEWLYTRSESGQVDYQDAHAFASAHEISVDGLRALTQHLEGRAYVDGIYTLGGRIQVMILAGGIYPVQGRPSRVQDPAGIE